MDFYQKQNNDISNSNNYIQYNNYNQSNYPHNPYPQNYSSKIKPSNNLINADFNYQQNFSPPGISEMNHLYPQKNNFINDKDNNNIHNKNNYPENNLIYQNYIPHQKNIVYNIPNNNMNNNNLINYNGNERVNLITRNQISKEEKEKKRKKQMEYNEELKRQIEEKNKRKEIEKKKKLEEDLKIEEKIQRQILEEQKELNLKKQQLLEKQRQEEELSHYQNTKNTSNEISNNPITNNQTSSSNFNKSGNNYYNNQENINQYNNNINNNYQPYGPPPQSSIPTMRSNFSSNSNNSNRNNIKKYYMNFVEEQLSIIDEYEEKINNYNSTGSNYENIINEKNEALKQIQTSQNNFKNNFGVIPMNEQFNNKVANIMDQILEQKVKDIKKNNFVNDNADNLSNINNNNLLEQSKRSTGTFNLNENTMSKQLNKDLDNDIIGCGYKSKYEELKSSIINGEDISNELKISMSLIGDSKFVVQNKFLEIPENRNTNTINSKQNLNDLYTTWKEPNFETVNNDTQNNEEFKIEEINNNEEPSNNNINNQKVIIGDSSEDIPIKNNLNNQNNLKNLNNDNNQISTNNMNINDSYMDKVNEALHKNSQKISKKEKNKSILLSSKENDNNANMNINNSTEDFLNVEKIEYPNYITKESQEGSKSINNFSNINSFQNYTSSINNNNLKNYTNSLNNNNKTYESDENVVIGNISLNTTLKNSRNANQNFNNTGKTNTLVKEMKLNEVEEKEEELYESEFKEDLKDQVKKIEEEENYENEFENEDINEIKKLEEQENKEKNKVNLDDYKEIHESQKIQTQLNFFEDSILDNININKSRGHIVGNSFKNEKENNEEGNDEENRNVLMSSELKDSYGDKILQNLNKYRKMALGESSLSQND